MNYVVTFEKDCFDNCVIIYRIINVSLKNSSVLHKFFILTKMLLSKFSEIVRKYGKILTERFLLKFKRSAISI